ncbi:MAG: hypothetical protein J6U54_13330 [Clostridiales bacterium]|nr:hypothetical protein [Clostridiales bacterium]
MARAYQCDRCGAFFTRGEYCGNYRVTLKMCENPEDLCPLCGKELENWMQNKADFVPKEVEEGDV